MPACLAPVLFEGVPFWLAIPTSIICGAFLPVTYIGILLLQRSKAYLGADRPEGARGTLWTIGLLLATLVVVVGLTAYLIGKFG